MAADVSRQVRRDVGQRCLPSIFARRPHVEKGDLSVFPDRRRRFSTVKRVEVSASTKKHPNAAFEKKGSPNRYFRRGMLRLMATGGRERLH